MLRRRAPAKINLWLNVFAPDATGYHPLDTLFCAVDHADDVTIEMTATEGIDLVVSGADVGPHEKNLARRAAVEFHQTLGIAPRLRIVLQKNIPAGAGLGGGSSDAAAVLLALNELHDGAIGTDDLMSMAARLGSDVPFFLCGSALAHATGRGEVLRGLPSLPVSNVLIAVPAFAIGTRDAYRWLDAAGEFAQPRGDDFTQPHDWHEVDKRAANTFESVLFARYPELEKIRHALRATGARNALLSGSGSAMFGVYADEMACHKAASVLRALQDVRVIETRTRA